MILIHLKCHFIQELSKFTRNLRTYRFVLIYALCVTEKMIHKANEGKLQKLQQNLDAFLHQSRVFLRIKMRKHRQHILELGDWVVKKAKTKANLAKLVDCLKFSSISKKKQVTFSFSKIEISPAMVNRNQKSCPKTIEGENTSLPTKQDTLSSADIHYSARF